MRSNGYALSNEAHKDFVTFGLFDGFLPLREVGFKDIDEVSVWVNSPENRLAVAAVMASVCYGDESDREVLCELLETIPTEAARRARLAKWDDKKRSSMNTIVDNWRKNAAAIRKAAK